MKRTGRKPETSTFFARERACGARIVRGAFPGRTLPLLGALLLALPGCGEDGGTDIAPAPAELVRLSPAVDSTRVGEALDPPLSVRVENSLGEPVEGIPVRFSVVDGPGELAEGLAVSNKAGVAETTLRAASEFGEGRVRVDIPSASGVSPLEFRVVLLPAEEVRVRIEEGQDQEAEILTQLALPFEVTVTAGPDDVPAGGVSVTWEIEEGSPGNPRLDTDTTFTDEEGRTSNLLTLGGVPGGVTVRVHAAGGVGTDTVRFEAEALEVLSGPARIDSVSPSPLRAGEEAILFGSGLGTRLEDTEVRIEGADAEILEVEDRRIRFRVPEFTDRCRPRREVGVRALVRGEPSNGTFASLRPREAALDLEVGAARTLDLSDGADCLRLGGGDEAATAEFLLFAGSGARTSGAVTPMRLLFAAGGLDADLGEGTVRAARSGLPDPAEVRSDLGSRHLQLRRSVERELGEWRITPPAGETPAARAFGEAEATSPPVRGDTLRFNFAVTSDFAVACDDTSTTVAGVVRSVGPRFALVEDTAVGGSGFRDADWAMLQQEYEEVVFPSDSSLFGSPADLDRNGRIVVLFTPRVNALTPPGAQSVTAGFFLPLDLADSGDPEGGGIRGADGEVCPASNEGEIIYMRTPDPSGRFGATVRHDQAIRTGRTIVAHELEHLLNAQRRIVFGGGDFTSLQSLWLDEGLAHFAEEMAGLRAMGLEGATELAWDRIVSDPRALSLFNTFHLDNFARLQFFLQEPNRAPFLASVDPGGLRSLQMRGVAWAFVRWLVDQHAGGDPAGFVRRLASGGASLLQGIAAVEDATGRGWDELVADFRLALAVDDAGYGPGLAPSLEIRTWDLRSVYAGLHENRSSGRAFPLPFPLIVTPLQPGTSAVDFRARASTGSFFRIDGERTGPAAVRLTGQSGGRLPASARPQVTVLRLR